MNAFRLLLVLTIVIIGIYTGIVIGDHGWNLFAVFFGDIEAMGWPGQFNLDFLFMLIFSGLWIMWRNAFSPVGIVLGVIGFFGGAPFLSAYLLWASYQAKGDIRVVFLGPSRA